MRYRFSTDARMLAAGNARGLRGGDSDRMPVSPTAGAVTGSGPRFDLAAARAPLQLTAGPVIRINFDRQSADNYLARLRAIAPTDLDGDLDANAARLGVNVADLVRLRRHRRDIIRRLIARKG